VRATEQPRERECVTREDQDAFALRSHQAAAAAWDAGFYDNQVLTVPGVDLGRDESIRPDTTSQRLAALASVFRPDGPVTAGNASPLNDGASAALLGSAAAERHLGLPPLARIAGRGAAANEPQYFGFAPVEAANIALKRAGIRWGRRGRSRTERSLRSPSPGLHQGMDPSSSTHMAAPSRSATHLGASGTRILGTLARSLIASGQKWGVAAICIGVGQGLAVVLENMTNEVRT
jgi:acetyl-CoA acetyltransferase